MPDYELSNVCEKYKSDTSLTSNSDKRYGGLYISTAKAFILALLAIAIAVGVGIIVHFAGRGQAFECKCTYPASGSGGNTEALDQCKLWASEGNKEICNACQGQVTTSACPTAATAATETPGPATTLTTSSTKTTTVSTTASTPKPPPVDVRLPKNVYPLLYTVELQPNMYKPLTPDQFTFNGSVKLLFRCDVNTNAITLHSHKLNITGLITVTEENEELYQNHTFDLDRQFLIVHTKKELQANKTYTLKIEEFVGLLRADLAGLYLSSYKQNNTPIHIATTQMQPTDARKTFPCFDEPAIKAAFDVTLVLKGDMKSISNMPINSTFDRGGGWRADHFERTPMMSTYLLAFIICDFNYTQNITKNDVKYRAWSRPEAIDQTYYSLKVGVEILTFFEEYFNVSYPLPKQDMIAIPDFAAGAMENWGLITYRETAMLYEPGVSSAGNKQRVAVVVSHELAHQWFGNLVTPSWWDDLWLNEGFASYVEYMGVDHVHPDWKMFEQFVVDDLHDVFNFDGLISSHPVYVPVAHPDEINEIFDRISYGKGASIIRMMRFFLGDETFRIGLQDYLKNHSYGAAFHDDLWYALGNQSMEDGNNITNVKDIMDTWTLQMNYPVVTVTHKGPQTITLTQSRYLRDPNATDPGVYNSPFNYVWKIPFAFATNTQPTFNVTKDNVTVMSTKEQTINSTSIPSKNDTNWVLGNPMQYGYYRVNYDKANWDSLIQQLRIDHMVIPAINRAQIINDAWNLAGSGELDMNIALATTEYLDKENEYVPWTAASNELRFVSTMLERNPLYGSFTKFMRNKTAKLFEDLGMNNTNATHLDSFIRSNIASLACTYNNKNCTEQAQTLFAKWMEQPSHNPIDPALKSVIYCTAIAEGGIEEWDFTLKQYKFSNLATEQARLLSALACTKQTWILSRYLEMSIDYNEVRRQDAVSVMVAISRNTIGRSLVWDFFRAKWDFLKNDFGTGSFSFSSLISGITSTFNTEFELGQLQQFNKTDLGSGNRAFNQALEKTQSNIKWMSANVPIIRNWLQKQGY